MRCGPLVFATAACLGLPAFAAAPNEPSTAQIRHAAESCTAQGAFGVSFGNATGSSPRQAGPEWAPIQSLLIRPGAKTGQVHEIEAQASFAAALMSGEDRIALASWVYRALDSAIQARHDFVKREDRRNGVVFRSAGDGVTLDLSHDETLVRIVCTEG